MCGDLNADGVVGVTDVIIPFQMVAGRVTPTDAQLRPGDLNQDGVVNVFDAVPPLQHIVGRAPVPTECGVQ